MTHGLVDYHMHTPRCGHATGSMEEYVQEGIRQGLAEIGFSDHLYLYWIHPRDKRDVSLAMPEEQLPEYVDSVLRLREKYHEISIRLGLEADYIAGQEEELRSILRPYPWDYLYGSVHFIGDWPFDDPRHIDRFTQWDVDDLYRLYFDLIKRAAGSGIFDVMGHLDVVKKFGHRPKGDMSDLYDEVARALKAGNVAIELSTAGLRKPVREVYPGPDLLAACARHQVPATLGSDAHKPTEVASDYPKALEALRAAGYREVVRFQGRQRFPIAI